ncbi:MAG: hypothetical protein H0T46_25715 [Deltaproteobacteria bacterium]|nr:hypothetical protein [Deltaproteobacteria bacterium]
MRLRVNPSDRIPPAYYASFPLTVEDSARLSANVSRARRAELLALETAARLDVLGTPIGAGTRAPAPNAQRRVVWTTRSGAHQCERSVLLLTKLLVRHFEREHAHSIESAVEALVGERVVHNFWWGEAPVCAIAVGALAWQALAERQATMPPTTTECGAKLYVRVPDRPLAELSSPFDPLVELLTLGIGVVGIGDEAVAIEVVTGG